MVHTPNFVTRVVTSVTNLASHVSGTKHGTLQNWIRAFVSSNQWCLPPSCYVVLKLLIEGSECLAKFIISNKTRVKLSLTFKP